MSCYHDRDGEPLTRAQWSYLVEQCDYQVVRQTELANGRFVSTVWLGLDLRPVAEPPFIFETMVFDSAGGGKGLFQHRYATEDAALAGHAAACARWRFGRRLKKRVRAKKIARACEDFAKRMRRARDSLRAAKYWW